ncbi:MAG TPA: VCBS repeat-containing protein [Vicinamibacterales bacterium]|nr:VCBS repeat-containing protein [Vicinamibacterales bacterium]
MLTSWKEIASFFHREVRTVQRWERDEGLPVHRHRHQRRSSVYAYPEELESWWARHEADSVAPAGTAVSDVAKPADHQPPGDRPDTPGAPGTRDAHSPVTFRWALAVVVCAALTGATAPMLTDRSSAGGYPRFDIALLEAPAAVGVRSMDDVNGDGRGDVVVQPAGGAEILVYLSQPGSGVRSRPDVRIAADGTAPLIGGSVGDVDGDGLADLILSVMLTEPATYTATGPSYLVRGRREWPDRLQLPRDADTEFYVDYPGDIRMIACTTGNGLDLNGDGLRDVMLGGGDFSPPGRPSAGGVFVLFGRQGWPKRVEVIAAADIAIHGSRSGEALRPYCGAGDFTGDGRQDLALAASEDTLWGLRGGRGRVYVLAGRLVWPQIVEADADATLRLIGSSPSGSVAPPLLTDVNGDGPADLVVAISDPSNRGSGGRVAIVFGGRERRGTVRDEGADVLILGGSTFGQAIAALEVNLDNLADLLVSEPGTGTVRMLLGRYHWPRGRVAAFNPVILAAGVPGTAESGLSPGDYDGDDAPDVALVVADDGATQGVRRLVRLEPSLPIEVDVRPGAVPNVLVPNGVVAVGVSAGSLASELDATSLRLVGVAPARLEWQDFDGDGSPDLRLYFEVSRLPVRPNATRLALRGRTRDGLPVAGADDVVILQHPRASLTTDDSTPILQRDH